MSNNTQEAPSFLDAPELKAGEIVRFFDGNAAIAFGSFLAAFEKIMDGDVSFIRQLNDWFKERNRTILTSKQHFSWLLSRCYQYLFVTHFENGWSRLATLDYEEWYSAIQTIHTRHLAELHDLCTQKIMATFLENRYAAFGAVLAELLDHYEVDTSTIVDLACSVNLGAILPFYPTFAPRVERSVPLGERPLSKSLPGTIVGVDIQPIDLHWIAACYWPLYVASMLGEFAAINEFISRSGVAVQFVKADITDPSFVARSGLVASTGVVNSSLVQYLLSQEMRDNLRQSAALLLKEGGFFVETDAFTPGQSLAEPLAVETRVSRLRNGKLSEPLTVMRFAGDSTLKPGGRPSDSCAFWQVDTTNLQHLRQGRFNHP